MKIAIVASRFNPEIVDGLIAGAMDGLRKSGTHSDDVTIIRVPGAFEIPLAAQRAAISKKFDGIIAIGCVMQGETHHFEYISQQATLGVGRVALDHNIPVAFGILTVDTEEQAMARAEANENNKGFEAAMAAVEMINVLRKL
jgi:6,7-dimethyl-8-ribityllumazine synthase